MNEAEGLYERVLEAAGGSPPTPRPPRSSAAVVLWRGEGDELEVYWLRRGRSLPFMGGWYAFPGGAVDRADVALPLAGVPAHPDPAARTSGLPDQEELPEALDLSAGVAAAALRELFEETGVLLGANLPAAALAELRAECLTRSGAFGDGLRAQGIAPDAGRLTFAGRWLTPPFTPVRFDNRFFLARWRPSDGEPSVLPPESEEGEWVPPARALARILSGEAMAAPPIVHLLRVLAEEGPERGVPRLLDTAEANLGPMRRIELRLGILMFPLAAATLPPSTHTNCFLLGRDEALLVDPGSPFPRENERLVAALAAARERLGRRAIAILLTHHHPDHVAGARELSRRLDLPVWAHAATRERIAGRGIAVDRDLEDGERLALAGSPPTTLRLHHTPGHARGHLAIEVEGAGDLIGGDLVSGFGTIVIAPPEGNMEDYLTSLERMRGRGFRTLFPAHGAAILDVDGKLAEYLEHRLAREAQVLELWRAGTREPGEMLAAVYPEVPPAILPLAERQILAHLERLRALGALSR
ncbi:MAG: MBL fold metallo-hydrolase [Holophagales bacterium]|nr:MBL fold metallo-hydrolase [Holophagales bacterium]